MNNEGRLFSFIATISTKGMRDKSARILPILSPLGSSRPLLAVAASIALSDVTFGLWLWTDLRSTGPSFDAISPLSSFTRGTRSSSSPLSCQENTRAILVGEERDKADFIPVSAAAASVLLFSPLFREKGEFHNFGNSS